MMMRVVAALERADAVGIWAFTPDTFSALLGGVEPDSRNLMLKRLCDREVLVQAAEGVYVNPVALSLPGDIRLGLVSLLRPGEISYVSLEYRLSEVGVISQCATALTLMTTGSSHRFYTPWGIIDFTHSDQAELLADGVELLDGGLLPVATVDRAYRDLKRVGRNMDLVDMDVLFELTRDEVSARRLDAPRSLQRGRDVEVLEIETLRGKIDIGLEQAERGEFSKRSVVEIADAVLAEPDEPGSTPCRAAR